MQSSQNFIKCLTPLDKYLTKTTIIEMKKKFTYETGMNVEKSDLTRY